MDDDQILSTDELSTSLPPITVPAAERYARAEAVLQYLSAPKEEPLPDALSSFYRRQNLEGAQQILRVLDPKEQFSRFFAMDSAGLESFLDRDSRAVSDSRVEFSRDGEAPLPSELWNRFRRAAIENPPDRPLLGLRIAIDPGHMGSDLWDERTGKFVKDKNGAKLSEGMLNLQTALLLEAEFLKLGAAVMLTHRNLGPVSSLPYEQLSLEAYGRQELRNVSLSDWFENLLATGPAGPGLYRKFASSAPYKKLFSEASRSNYFILRADLSARPEAMLAFDPDISLVIHYDASGPNLVSPVPTDGTKVYIVGAFDPGEFATQKSRFRFAKHLLRPDAFSSSLGLGRFIVQQLQADLGLKFDKHGGGTSFEVEPGVFARNLGVSAGLGGHAVSFLEVLHYDDPNEFRMLRDFKYNMIIDGVSAPYSERLIQVVNAIRTGTLKFVASYSPF